MKKFATVSSTLLFSLIPLFYIASCATQNTAPLQSADVSTTDQSTRDPAAERPQSGSYPAWAYDAGPDPQSPMGKQLIDLNASIPHFPQISQMVTGDQKFRPAFGPIAWRLVQKPNSVKILFIGQDGTHIAEAAGRPATAGFGGRAQSLAEYFGVSSSAAFINTYAFTIKGQAAAFGTPVFTVTNEKKSVAFTTYTDNQLWLISQDQQSPITKWRNDLIDWIVRNNSQSLKMIVTFGGAARDSFGSFVVAKGEKVGSKYSEADLANVRVPEIKMESAGSNKEVPVPLTLEGKDYYEELLGRRVNYKDATGKDYLAAQNALKEAMKANPEKVLSRLAFTKGGVNGSGVLNAAQIAGYDIDDKMEINGHTTLSIKGLKLSDGSVLKNDVLVIQLPHPTSLSSMTPQAASDAVGKALQAFKPYTNQWKIDADPGLENQFAQGKSYKYGRAYMGPEYYDFGAPNSRMVAKSDASRLNPNTIIFGTRDAPKFDQGKLKAMTEAKPSKFPSSKEMWITRPRSPETRYTFDMGPGEKFAKIMKENIPQTLVDSHQVNGDFGHFRGTFVKPRVLMLADPHGYDDLITARALTGTRGQYLHGLMSDLGVEEKYLVIKTAPFALVDTDPKDWSDIMSKTNSYRENLLKAILAEGTPEVIIADGESAIAEIKRILPTPPCPVVNISRAGGKSDSGIMDGAAQLEKIPGFTRARASGKMQDIPRAHLTYYARIWEGTSGDRVITSSEAAYAGKAFAEVAPKWAISQKYEMTSNESTSVKALVQKLEDNKLPVGDENIAAFLKRINQ